MEGRMVNHNIILIKTFFEKKLPHFLLLSENSYSMFWEINFGNNDLKIKVSGDIGGFSISIFIENGEYSLWQYDRSVVNAMKTNDKNIMYQLEILKKFITEVSENSQI